MSSIVQNAQVTPTSPDRPRVNPNKLTATWNAVLTIAARDMRRFLSDRPRIIGTLIFPLLFIGVLGGSLQSSLGSSVGYSFLLFTFSGILAQTLFQSTTTGLTSLLEDRDNDFSQEMFIAPISRYAIIFGKILGESSVAYLQALATLIFGILFFTVPLDPVRLLGLLVGALIVCLLGGAFGVLILSLFSSQRSANQIIPYLIFPQFFLAGVFSPIRNLPWYLDILSRIMPLRYAVDLTRGLFYAGTKEYNLVVLQSPLINFIVVAAMFTVFLVVGTVMFVRNERNR